MGQMNDVILVFSTFPDSTSARQIGTRLIESQLAACVNLCPSVESIYRWQGQIETAQETLAIFKTTRGVWPLFQASLLDLHPYDTPEIIALKPEDVSPRYAVWVSESTSRITSG